MCQSKKEGKDRESIQSSTIPYPGYQWESDNFTIRHNKREPRGQPFLELVNEKQAIGLQPITKICNQ